MHIPVVKVSPHVNQEHLDFFRGPIKDSRQGPHQKALKSHVEILVLPHAKLLVLGIFRPCIDRPLILPKMDVLEPYVDHHLSQFRDALKGASDFGHGFCEEAESF